MKNILLIMLIGLFVSACTTPKSSVFTQSHQQAKISQNHKSSGKARITFVRNRNDRNIPIITAVSIDDWVVATLGPGEKTTLEVDAGLRHVGLKGKSTPMTLKPARDYYFYIKLNKEGTNYEIHSVLESQTKRLQHS